MIKKIPVRAPRFDLGAIPRDWLASDPLASDLVDALSLIFPEGERFFIRAVQHFAETYEGDPELRAAVKGFVGQEGRHGHEHDRLNRAIASHGPERAEAVKRFLSFYQTQFFGRLEPATPPVIRLATTSALEHLTATLAEVALGTKVLDDAHPEIARMLRWHALEEIEHRAVSFEVLQKVDPRLRVRAAGVGMGLGVLGAAWLAAFVMLRSTSPGGEVGDAHQSRRFWGRARRTIPEVAGALRRYLQRDFHPDRPVESRRTAKLEARYQAVLASLAV